MACIFPIIYVMCDKANFSGRQHHDASAFVTPSTGSVVGVCSPNSSQPCSSHVCVYLLAHSSHTHLYPIAASSYLYVYAIPPTTHRYPDPYPNAITRDGHRASGHTWENPALVANGQ